MEETKVEAKVLPKRLKYLEMNKDKLFNFEIDEIKALD
jgi:hypothetical protein